MIRPIRRTKNVENSYLPWDRSGLGPSPTGGANEHLGAETGSDAPFALIDARWLAGSLTLRARAGQEGTNPVPESSTDPCRSYNNLKEKGKERKTKRQKNEYLEFLLHRDSDCCRIEDDHIELWTPIIDCSSSFRLSLCCLGRCPSRFLLDATVCSALVFLHVAARVFLFCFIICVFFSLMAFGFPPFPRPCLLCVGGMHPVTQTTV